MCQVKLERGKFGNLWVKLGLYGMKYRMVRNGLENKRTGKKKDIYLIHMYKYIYFLSSLLKHCLGLLVSDGVKTGFTVVCLLLHILP